MRSILSFLVSCVRDHPLPALAIVVIVCAIIASWLFSILFYLVTLAAFGMVVFMIVKLVKRRIRPS